LAGIGPEVLVKALSRKASYHGAKVLVLADGAYLNLLARRYGLRIRFQTIESLNGWEKISAFIPCFFDKTFPSRFPSGASRKNLTTLAVRSIELAVKLALEHRIDAIVTSPINKAGLKKAGFDIPGHTEFLAKLSKTKRYDMMLVGGKLRVVLVTRHLPIQNVSKNISARKVEETILLTDRELRRSFGIRRPRLVVCGLNPHAGESGTIGREEITVIAPAVRRARMKTNAKITGPLSPDALFYKAYCGHYDAEICMYHDQGLIPLKMISRGHGVNVTLGLPFVRTSPDHGTAYDIASIGIADPGSMIAALKTAVDLSRKQKQYDASGKIR
jgi:4-hydroxythreonine-4-phosphate dehydrogenase